MKLLWGRRIQSRQRIQSDGEFRTEGESRIRDARGMREEEGRTKDMARVARETLEGKYFHILVSGIDELKIFNEHKMKAYYTELLLKNEGNILLLTYSIMENHVHIAFYSEGGIKPVAEAMKKINTAFALQFNKYKRRNGYVFRSRFKSQPLTGAREAAGCMAFIHSNPIFENPRFSAKTYPYSGYKRVMGGEPKLSGFAEELGVNLQNLGEYVESQGDAYPLYHWIDVHSFVVKEDFNYVLDDLAVKYNVRNYAEVAEDKEKMGAFASELSRRTGMSILFISKEMGVGRETLRRAVKKYEEKTTQNQE